MRHGRSPHDLRGGIHSTRQELKAQEMAERKADRTLANMSLFARLGPISLALSQHLCHHPQSSAVTLLSNALHQRDELPLGVRVALNVALRHAHHAPSGNFRCRQEPAVFRHCEAKRNDFRAIFVTKCQFQMEKGKHNTSNGVSSHLPSRRAFYAQPPEYAAHSRFVASGIKPQSATAMRPFPRRAGELPRSSRRVPPGGLGR